MADITLYRNNEWIPTITLTWPTEDQRDERPFTAADATAEGDPILFLSKVLDTDTMHPSTDSPAHFLVSATLIDAALDGDWKLKIEQANVTTANLALFLSLTAYLHIRLPGGSSQVLSIPILMNRPAVAA